MKELPKVPVEVKTVRTAAKKKKVAMKGAVEEPELEDMEEEPQEQAIVRTSAGDAVF